METECLLISTIILIIMFTFIYQKIISKRNILSSINKISPSSNDRIQYDSFRVSCKMVLCVRNDLGMSKGKIGAQCGHAAVGAFSIATKDFPHYIKAWNSNGCVKIVLSVKSEIEILDLEKQAIKAYVPFYLVMDAGRTQVEPGSLTVLAIGPGPNEIIDKLTGKLKLL